DLARLEQRVLARQVGGLLERGQFDDVDAVERPAMRIDHRLDLRPGLRQRDVQTALAERRPGHQELHAQRRLADARIALYQIDPVPRQAAVQDGVESGDAGRGDAL